jgi:hypothetical protein
MTSQKENRNRINTFLVVLVLINIIGDIGNIIFWYAEPSSRGSLIGGNIGGIEFKGGYIAVTAGADAAVIAGTTILTIVSIIYVVGLYGLLKRRTWAPLLVIAISIANRAMALLLFELNEAFAFFSVWTVILVVVAYLDYRKLSATKS